ncbi:hypothetical protein OH807_31940 [Kitasatospora sp. NBC_01560]|uniref:hypothetical protein n=1 Tax=Kitasatospora sp. NBC_01560 TaxID=2975965 RepID=UPI003868BBCB
MATTATPQDIADRYVALWTEPDPALRRKAIERIWTEDGVHLIQPPEEIRDRAAALGFDDTVLEVSGYDAIETRVTRSHQEFIAPGEFTFRAGAAAVRLRNCLRFTWEMVPVGGGEPVGSGLEVLLLDEDGRVTVDYQFPGA